ncbi:hypothetical protein [Deinococcus altitudinis]|uniref:hypothetical protein n=1 Tax=Deinococcus altitudinis TaxID=468914 RepID=UPI0038922343
MRPTRPARLARLLLALTLLPAAGLTLAQSTLNIPATPPKTSAPAMSAPTMSAPAVAAPAATTAMSKEAVLARGRQLVTWFYAQNLDPVWAAFLPTARADFGGDLSAFKTYRANGVTNFGKESRLLSEDVQSMDGVTYYLRTATFEKGPRVQWTVAFGLNAQGQVVNFGILGGTEAAPDQQASGRSGGL